MSTLTSLARAQARSAGIAQPIARVRHVHVSDRPLVFVPLGLAGEACAPLAAVVGTDPADPRLLVVSQPRNRDQRFAFAADLARIIVPYVTRFSRSVEQVAARSVAGQEPGGEQNRVRFTDAPQLLVPGRASIGFVRLLGRSTRFRRTDGEFAVEPTVPLLGRWLTFLAERTEHPGSCLLLAATDALASHWASGQSLIEDENLAALMAWIDPPDGLTGEQAAAAAEDPVLWPPAGPSTDPTFDNEVLYPLIQACAQAATDSAGRRARDALEHALAGQLMPTWQLMWRAVDVLRALPAGEHVAGRWDADRDAFTNYMNYLRDGGAPQPRRDQAVAAARRLNWLERTQTNYAAQRAFDDPLAMAEYRMSGEAFAGRVVEAEPDRLDGTGKRRKLRPWITVETTDAVTIGAGETVVSPARREQRARVRSISAQPGPVRVGLELSGGMGRSLIPAPGSVPAIGEWLCYSTLTDGYRPVEEFPAAEETPWTHGGPPVRFEPGSDGGSGLTAGSGTADAVAAATEDAVEEWS
jgi:hypothetical protein